MLGVAPTWKDFVLAIPIGMIAYTGIETISNMAEEAKDEITTIPAAIKRVRDRRLRDLLHAAGRRARRAAGDQAARRRVHDAAGPARGPGRLRGRPDRSAWSRTSTSGAFQRPAEIYVGLLAATILFLATNAGLIGVSRLVYSMGIHRQLPDRLRRLHPKYRTPWIGIIVFGVVAILVTLPGPGRRSSATSTRSARCCRSRSRTLAVIRLRIAKPEFARPYRPPGNVTIRGVRRPAVRGHRRARARRSAFVVIVVPAPGGRDHRRRLAVARRRRLHPLPPPPGARPDLDAQGRDRAAGRRSRGRVRLGARADGRRRATTSP